MMTVEINLSYRMLETGPVLWKHNRIRFGDI
jgi:hypothetical protein